MKKQVFNPITSIFDLIDEMEFDWDAVVAKEGGTHKTLSAAIADGKKTIFYKNGNYTETTEVTITQDNTVIIGESWETVQIHNHPTGNNGIRIQGANNCIISGFTVDCETYNQWSAVQIIDGQPSGSPDATKGCNNLIYKMRLKGNQTAPLATGKFCLYLAGINAAVDQAGTEYDADRLCTGNKVIGCTMSSGFQGDAYVFALQKNGVFEGNTCIGGRIAPYMLKNCSIVNNDVIDSVSQGIALSLPSQNVEIAHNRIWNCAGHGISTNNQLEHNFTSSVGNNISIHSNKIYSPGLSGVSATGGTTKNAGIVSGRFMSIFDNAIYDAGFHGIYLQDIDNFVTTNNLIQNVNSTNNSRGSGIYMVRNVKTGTIAHNVIKDDRGGSALARHAIASRETANCTDVTVTANVISGNYLDRTIWVDSAGWNIAQNQISGGKYAGVYLVSAGNATVIGNKFTNNTNDANNAWGEVWIKGTQANVIVDDNTFESTAANKAKYGIWIEDATCTGVQIGQNQFIGIVTANVGDSGTGTVYGVSGAGSAGKVAFWNTANTVGASGLYWNDTTKRLGLNTTSPGVAKFDLVGGGNGTGGIIDFLVGGDNNVDISGGTLPTRTDSVNKAARLGMIAYTIANRPSALIVGTSTASATTIAFGGGTSGMNAATKISFYTAADTNTATGSERLYIDSAGAIVQPALATGTMFSQTMGANYAAGGIGHQIVMDNTQNAIIYGQYIDMGTSTTNRYGLFVKNLGTGSTNSPSYGGIGINCYTSLTQAVGSGNGLSLGGSFNTSSAYHYRHIHIINDNNAGGGTNSGIVIRNNSTNPGVSTEPRGVGIGVWSQYSGGLGIHSLLGASQTGSTAFKASMDNTQSGANTLIDLNTGSSSYAHIALNIASNSGSNASRAIKIASSSASAGTIIDITTGSASGYVIYSKNSNYGPAVPGSGGIQMQNFTSTFFQVRGDGSTTITGDYNGTVSATCTSARTEPMLQAISNRFQNTNNAITDNYHALFVQRNSTMNYNGQTFTQQGSVARLENNYTQSLGTLNDSVVILSLINANASTGGHILFNNYQPTTAPTAEGTMYYDGSVQALKMRQAGITQTLESVIFSQTATRTITNTTTETSQFSTGVGTLTLPANFFKVGKTIRLMLRGYISTTGTPNATIRIKLGSTVIHAAGPSALPANLSNNQTLLSYDITCRSTGATGTVQGQGYSLLSTVTGTPGSLVMRGMTTTATTTIDTTASQTIDVTYEFGTADAANTLNITNASVEVLN